MSVPDPPRNPACSQVDCVTTSTGPCSASAPPWPRVKGCTPSPLACMQPDACLQRNRALVMRRKAEVLQHRRNALQMSRKLKWSRIVRGVAGKRTGRWATQNDLLTDPNTQKLPPGRSPFTLRCGPEAPVPPVRCPTSASNVPGKIVPLWLDRRIPAWGVGPTRRAMQGGGIYRRPG